jgi:uncharacterized phage protein (TIGR02220 family)
MFYKIKDWDEHYENNRTKELRRMEWVPFQNRHDGNGFRTLIHHRRGLEFFGAWILIVEVASRCKPRGTLVKKNGAPHTAESIARMTGGSAKTIEKAIELLSSDEIAWIEKIQDEYVEPIASDAQAKKIAHGRITRALRKGDLIQTPTGAVTIRPRLCQWCGEKGLPKSDPYIQESRNIQHQTHIFAHHILGYGSLELDFCVIFTCRHCHQLFENRTFTIGDVVRRYGVEWIPRVFFAESREKNSQDGPKHCRRNGTEGKEEKGKKNVESCRRIVDYLNAKLGSRYKADSAETKELISQKLKEGHKEEEFRRVIDGRIRVWRGNARMSQYLRPKTLFGQNFEAYLNAVQPPEEKIKRPCPQCFHAPTEVQKKCEACDGRGFVFD